MSEFQKWVPQRDEQKLLGVNGKSIYSQQAHPRSEGYHRCPDKPSTLLVIQEDPGG